MRILPLALIAFLPSSAMAACPDQTILTCQIGKKQLELCQSNETLTYSFGPKAKPEITLTAKLANGVVEPWPGVGRAIVEGTRFENNGTTYEVWLAFDRLVEDSPLESGVNVLKGEDLITSLACDPGTLTAPGGVFAMSDAMITAGYCRDDNTFEWTKTCP